MYPIDDHRAHGGCMGSKYFECTQFLIAGHIVITYCLCFQCVQHVPTGYLGPCPQCLSLGSDSTISPIFSPNIITSMLSTVNNPSIISLYLLCLNMSAIAVASSSL